MDKINFKKDLGYLYNASSRTPSIVQVPEMYYLKIEGEGSPEGQGFQHAAGTLYPIAYTLKYMIRENLNIDFGVMPMEVQWNVNRERKGEFTWTMMLMQPHYIAKKLFEEACDRVAVKYNVPYLSKVRYENLAEGLCVQMMHKGDYNLMNHTLEIMIDYIKEQGYTSSRDTHDIYLNNVLKTKTENLKTIMRLPIFK